MPRAPLFYVSTLALTLAFSAVGCPCNGPINSSPELRWWLFSNFGAQKICPEMLKRGVPIKLAPLGPGSVGRYFPQQCQVQVDDAHHSIAVTVSGTGYATLPLARRVGFYGGMSVEYLPDFRLENDAMYVWGKFSRLLAPPDLRIVGVENPVVNLATRTPLGDVATVLGQGIVASEIGRGFTVVKQDDGEDFTMGHLDPPEKPKRQFKAGSDHVVLGSDLTEVHATSRDYLGPFEVTGNGQALYLKMKLTGGSIVYGVVDKNAGDAWRRSYEAAQPLGPPPAAPYATGGAGLGESQQKIAVPPGLYYLVVENQAQAPFAPLGMPLPVPEAVSYVSYSVEVGDK